MFQNKTDLNIICSIKLYYPYKHSDCCDRLGQSVCISFRFYRHQWKYLYQTINFLPEVLVQEWKFKDFVCCFCMHGITLESDLLCSLTRTLHSYFYVACIYNILRVDIHGSIKLYCNPYMHFGLLGTDLANLFASTSSHHLFNSLQCHSTSSLSICPE
jgi:hypothetical protein